MKRGSLKFTVLVAAIVMLIPSMALAIQIKLHSAKQFFPTHHNGRPVIAVGKDGFFLDSNHSAPSSWQGNPSMQQAFANWSDPKRNFTWQDVTLNINEHTGNGAIHGTMHNSSNSSDLYAFSMNLTDMCIKSSGTCTSRSQLSDLDLRSFLENPANSSNSSLGTDLKYGFEWGNVSLNIEALGNNPVYKGETSFSGWSMPPMHVNPIELHVWGNSPGPGNLYLQAWYQAFNKHGHRIAVGDTKSFGQIIKKPIYPKDPIPEPSTILLLSAAGLGLARKRYKDSTKV